MYRVAEVIGERYTTPTQTLGAEDLVTGFGKFVGLSPQQIDDLLFAARLHDLGMIQVPDAVVLKPAGLTPEELTLVKQHVTVGAAIFEPLRHRQAVAEIMRHHHERWDGNGYPHKLKGLDIPVTGRITGLVDAYDAMTSFRPYPPYQRTHEEAIAEIRRCAGCHFDPYLSEIFCNEITLEEIETTIL